jgi:F-box/WD-40 domain protein 7
LLTLTHALQRMVQVWDLNTLSRVKTLTGHTDAVRALSVSDGRLFSGSYDGTVRVWDEANLHCLEILKGHNGPVRTLVNCGGCMFSGSYDKTVRVWDVQTLECKAALTGHTGAVRALVASPEYVFSGSDDTTIKVSSSGILQPCMLQHLRLCSCTAAASVWPLSCTLCWHVSCASSAAVSWHAVS